MTTSICRRAFAAVLLPALLLVQARATFADSATIPTTRILVPAGTSVPVHLVGSIDSGSAKAGDVFQIQAARDVVVNGMIVIAKGAGGQGSVVAADSAGGNGHSGSLSLTFDYVNSVDGGRIKLSDTTQNQSEEDRKGAASTATIIGFATFGLGGLFGHNLAHGRQKKLDDTTIITAFTGTTVHVEASQKAEEANYDK